MPQMGLLAWLDKKIVDPLYQILRRGLEPKQLAFSTALGIALGIFPICGVTVLLCGLAIALLGSLCHAPTVLLANFIATPIELSLVVPFLRLGEVMSGGPPFPLTSDALKKVLTGQASREVILSIAHATLFGVVVAYEVEGQPQRRVFGAPNRGSKTGAPSDIAEPDKAATGQAKVETGAPVDGEEGPVSIIEAAPTNHHQTQPLRLSAIQRRRAAVGMASSSTFYFGCTLHNIFAMFQGLGSQVQHRSIKPNETIKFTRRNQLKVRDV
ncbi:hypothetical protein NC652_008290 [Populus alba x Populus x berolinensis]|nr:hypothetical protein NC652_008290 [Populus alba x Populus x berolinensis]